MNKKEKLRSFTEELKNGYQLVQNKKYQEAKECLEPFVKMLHSAETPNIRLLANYSIAQFGSGDIEGFLESYADLKELSIGTKQENEIVKQMDLMFQKVMDQMGNA